MQRQAKKSKRTAITRRKSRHIGRQPQRQANTSIVIAPPAIKPWELSTDEVAILKNAICKGASDEELKYCLTVARRYELDPFQKQIWFVPRWDSQAIASDGKKGATVYTPQISIDGLQYQAASHHADYGTFSETEYGPMIEVSYQVRGSGPTQRLKVPEWAKIKAFKKGSAEPSVGMVWWEEIYPNVDYAPLVRQMRRLMLGKCARAQVIRVTYPKKTGGLLIPEECYGREFTDITPGGRLISANPPAPEPSDNWDKREKEAISKLTPAQQEVVTAKMASANVVPCLFYQQQGEKYEITGPDELKKANRELLKRFYDVDAGTLFCSPEHLGVLIRRFEELHVPFRELHGV